MQVPLDIEELYQQAEVYHSRGDVYNAVKLCKRIIKRAPDWHPPYAMLGSIYKYRKEWKAALHYNKKAVAIDASDQNSWWNVGIAATALKKPRLAKSVWHKFGLENGELGLPPIKSVRIAFGKQFDIVWVRPVDPCRAVIESIPSPASGRRFRDMILLDGMVTGYNVSRQKKFPVYEELGIHKRSTYRTFSCWIRIQTTEDLQNLEKLCREADLGFENWSNAAWVFANQIGNTLPEYYGSEIIKKAEEIRELHIAIAAPTHRDVEEVLGSWQIISLGHFSNITCHL